MRLHATRSQGNDLRILFCSLAMVSFLPARAVSAQSITSIQPRSIQPGKSVEITLSGKELQGPLRAIADITSTIEVRSTQTDRAVLSITLPEDAPLGPMEVSLANETATFESIVLIVDDLPSLVETVDNHDPTTAQPVSTFIAVDGVSDGARSDFFRFQVAAEQRVAFEVLTQSLRSSMDPVARLMNDSGETLVLCDDDEVGPECRFSYTFPEAGEYWLEIHDNRFAAGGQYHLRIGDFPVVRHAFPLAVQTNRSSQVDAATLDGSTPTPVDVSADAATVGSTILVAHRLPGGQSSAWSPVVVREADQHVESVSTVDPLRLPIDIHGMISEEKERDEYVLQGVANQSFRFVGKTRSLGSRALLTMQLIDAAGDVVAQTPVDERDEWSFDFRFSDDATYRLAVTDLIGRGGSGFGYMIEVTQSPSFRLTMKADPKAAERFVMESTSGACAIDLNIERFGYDGEIDLSLNTPGIGLLNPTIPAKATAAKIYLVAESGWMPNAISLVEIVGTAADNKSIQSRLSSLDLQRAKYPHVLSSRLRRDGVLAFSGTPPSEPYLAIEPAEPVQFTAGAKSHLAKLKLRRINSDFKDAVTWLSHRLPDGWTLSTKVEKDSCTATIACTDPSQRPDTLPLLVYSQFNGRGRLSKADVAIDWIDPVRVELQFPAGPLIAGQTHPITIEVRREGDDAQPATLHLRSYPDGWSGPAAIDIPPDAERVSIEVTLANSASGQGVIECELQGQYHNAEFTIAERWSTPVAVPLPEFVEVYPLEIAFTTKDLRRQLIVTGRDANGQLRDWTRNASIESAAPDLVDVDGCVVHAKANGETSIHVRLGEHSIAVPVRVTGVQTKASVSFETEVLVALSKQGCNSGACHGSPSGKGMFRLSLRAFDKQLDELTLIREDFGRRVNRIEPEQSLLLLKPLMKVNHGGGKKLHEDDPAFAILRDWIADGARSDPADAPRCVGLDVFPSDKRILALTGGGQQLSVIARFSDGTRRDVTHLAAYESSNTAIAQVNEQGWVSALSRGESVILVRFLEHIESVPLMFIDRDPLFQYVAPPPNNYIDELVDAKLKQLEYLPSATSTDAEFLRRVHLDVIGILPTAEATRSFLADQRPDKRARLIDELLDRPEFAKFWALKWGDLLKLTGKMIGDEGVYKYHRWVEEAFRTNLPYDQFARALLAADGSTLSNPPANFYRTAQDMNDCVETVSQVFLGARLQCAKCHNHPFERWTQDNYYGLAAFFNRLERRRTGRPGEMFIYTTNSGEVTQPRTGNTMRPWLPIVGEVSVPEDQDRRDALVEWLVRSDNAYFARIESNRIWSQLFSRGIVDPIDDFRDSNPPSNGPLLDALAADFVEHGFDRKHLLRTILNSRTYQASVEANETNRDDMAYFSHQRPRLLTAEQLLDAVNHAMGMQTSFDTLPPGTRATQLPAPDLVNVDFLKVFGQPERSTVCACERVDNPSLGMAIELFNGATIHRKLKDPKNRFRRSVATGKEVPEIVRELYLAALCRFPTDSEIQTAMSHCATREHVSDGLEDLCWALMNTDEFLFQH